MPEEAFCFSWVDEDTLNATMMSLSFIMLVFLEVWHREELTLGTQNQHDILDREHATVAKILENGEVENLSM